MNSALYRGWVRHRRFLPVPHNFQYGIAFLWLDLDEIDAIEALHPWLSSRHKSALRFNPSDYLERTNHLQKEQVWNRITELGGENHAGRICLLGQVRCFGLYFSPINLFYCFDTDNQLQYLLAEVSNTPWNQRHYYLVPQDKSHLTDKDFHVSPFMDMDMRYRWRFNDPTEKLVVHIENHNQHKVFDATLSMNRYPLQAGELKRPSGSFPA